MSMTAPARGWVNKPRLHPDDDEYSVYGWGHIDFPDDYSLALCGIVLNVDDLAEHDGAEPCELCSPDRYERWSR